MGNKASGEKRQKLQQAKGQRHQKPRDYGPIDGLRKRENRLLRKINSRGGDILFFVDAAMTVVEEFNPSEPKQDGSGRRYFPIKPRIVARLIQQEYDLSFRELELLLEQNRLIRDKMGIEAPPDHNTLQRTCAIVREKDLQRIREGIGGYKDLLERQFKF